MACCYLYFKPYAHYYRYLSYKRGLTVFLMRWSTYGVKQKAFTSGVATLKEKMCFFNQIGNLNRVKKTEKTILQIEQCVKILKIIKKKYY
jgi:hypothetical protein